MYFFLLGIPFNFGPDASYKQGRFFKTLSEKSLELILSKKGSNAAFNLSFVLLPAEIDLVAEK